MNKMICVFLVVMTLFFIAPISGHAGRARVSIGANICYGHPGWWGPSRWWRHRLWRPGYYYGRPGMAWYGYPFGYYAPPPVVIQQPSPIYVEPRAQQAGYWYYCRDPQGYYPYVKNCPEGWMKVVPEVNPPNP